MKNLTCFALFIGFLVNGCTSSDDTTNPNPDPAPTELYFPFIGSNVWETSSVSEVGWNENALQPLLDFLEEKKHQLHNTSRRKNG